MRYLLALLLCATLVPIARGADKLVATSIEQDWKDPARNRIVPVKIDYPKTIAAPLPAIILSHGLGGSREGLGYIGTYWAEHGYVVVHLQHAGSDENVWKGVLPAEAVKNLQAAASPAQFEARVKDVKFSIDELTRRNDDPTWALHGRIDLKHLAMAGHSFGAVTAQAICGQVYPANQTFTDPRVQAGVVFSPQPPTNPPKTAFAKMIVPLFFWTGTKDDAPPLVSNVKAAQRRIPYDGTADVDKYLVILTGADHMTFNGRATGFTPNPNDVAWDNLIGQGTTAFLDKYLKSDAVAAKYLDGAGFSDDVRKLGTFEKKLVAKP